MADNPPLPPGFQLRPQQQEGALPPPPPGFQVRQQPQPPQTLQQRAQEVYGFKDYAERGTLLPFGKTAEGEIEFATPQILKDMAETALLPGHVMQGGSYTPKDATLFALDWLVPATAGRAPGGKRPPPTKKQFIANAPSTDDLRKASTAYKNLADSAGVRVDQDKFLDLTASVESLVKQNRLNPKLHPNATAAFEELTKAVGQDLDLGDLHILRRIITQAENSTKKELADDRRIAGIIRSALDDFVDNLPEDVGGNVRNFRKLWHRAAKSAEIEDIIARANRKASGFENGLRVEFRKLLDKKGGTRGFTPDEIALMEEIASGGSVGQRLTRLLGKLSFDKSGGSNFLGGSIGTAGGAAAGGAMFGPAGAAAGAVIPPAVGYVAQKGAESMAGRNAALMRALAATGGNMPRDPRYARLIENLLTKSGSRVAGTQMPRQSQRQGVPVEMPDGSVVYLPPDLL